MKANFKKGTTCPSRAQLLAHWHGYSTKEQRSKIESHLQDCAACSEDFTSLEFHGLELFVAAADRKSLEGFAPDRAHAEMCFSLGNGEIKRLARLGTAPPEPQIARHLADCPYCRQRLILAAAKARGNGQQLSLGESITAQLLCHSLDVASQTVARMVAWTSPAPALARLFACARNRVYQLRESLSAALDESSAVISSGLEQLMLRAQPALAKAATCDRGTVASPEAAWRLPVLDGLLNLTASPTADGYSWQISCHLVDKHALGRLGKARAQLVDGDGNDIRSCSLSDLADLPVIVSPGNLILAVSFGEEVFLIPLSVGEVGRCAD